MELTKSKHTSNSMLILSNSPCLDIGCINLYNNVMFDVVIIGSGIIGVSVARYLARYDLNICVLEQHCDISQEASKANSGIIHAGFDAGTGSQKAYHNVLGAKLIPQLAIDLDFPYNRNGAMVLCFDEAEKGKLQELLQRGKQNGVENLTILTREETLDKEPLINPGVVAALYAPSSGVVSPYEFAIAMAENAADNGVEFFFDSKVKAISRINNFFEIATANGKKLATKWIINCAGTSGDKINNMVCKTKQKISARKGEYMLFDKAYANVSNHTLFQLPTKLGKGILITKSAHGNILIGPNAVDITDKTDFSTSIKGQNEIIKKAKEAIPTLDFRQVITQFAGLRAHLKTDDFLIAESEPCFFNVIGIDSPGLTAAPSIAEYVSNFVADKLNAKQKISWQQTRKGIEAFSHMSNNRRIEAVRQNPLYGKIVCRCEKVTEAEVINSIRRTLGATTLDGIKFRTRAGMGRCQSSFCCPNIIEILSRELNQKMENLTKNDKGSHILIGKKEGK